MESASTVRVEVSRRIKDSKGTEAVSTIGQMYSFSLKDGFVIDGEPGFVLQPYDQVYVRRSPAYQEQVNVQVTGEVLYEGDDALTRLERTPLMSTGWIWEISIMWASIWKKRCLNPAPVRISYCVRGM